jgi:multidrug efflux pump subunit AcrB
VITDRLIPALDTFAAEHYPDLQLTLNPLQMGPPVAAPVQIRLSGRDPAALFAIVDATKARLAETQGARNVTDNWGPRSKKLVVGIDQARARRAGVTNQDVAISLQTALTGLDGTEFRGEDDIIPVTLRASVADSFDPGAVAGLNVYAQATGRAVPLSQVATVAVVWEPSKVLRRDRTRTVTVSAGVTEGVTASDIVDQIRPWLEAQQAGWPFGYGYALGGEIETSVKANQAIGEKVPIGLLLIVLLLVVQFNSIRRTAIVLLTIPLGLIGVITGLLMTGSYFGFMTILGVIALAGIVINNAIVLIDRIDIEIDDNGLSPNRAVIEAAQRRLRPILLTTATTVAGLIPLWFGGGPMWEPLAITIIFGLLFATLLTLGVVPLLYTLFFRVSFRETLAAPTPIPGDETH